MPRVPDEQSRRSLHAAVMEIYGSCGGRRRPKDPYPTDHSGHLWRLESCLAAADVEIAAWRTRSDASEARIRALEQALQASTAFSSSLQQALAASAGGLGAAPPPGPTGVEVAAEPLPPVPVQWRDAPLGARPRPPTALLMQAQVDAPLLPAARRRPAIPASGTATVSACSELAAPPFPPPCPVSLLATPPLPFPSPLHLNLPPRSCPNLSTSHRRYFCAGCILCKLSL